MDAPAQFRKKPVVISAIRYTGANGPAVRRFLGQPEHLGATLCGIRIETLEGNMFAAPGDWVLRGIAGEFYPCKDEIFRATYERVNGAERESDEPL